MSFTLPELKFELNALEPLMSKETVDTHYNKHHTAYLNKLNTLCEEQKIDTSVGIDGLIRQMYPETTPSLINNAGGFYNHNLFWENIVPNGSKLSEKFKKVILAEAGTRENLDQSLLDLGMGVFGSGWAWLVVRETGEVMGISTKDQISPNMPLSAEIEGQSYEPILAIDIWEHAYYIDHKNLRADYLKNMISLIDWSVVEKRYFDALDRLGLECPYDLS